MAYVGVEFSQNDTIGLVHSSWFTPLKHEVFWPPYKTSPAFNKALTSAEEPDQSIWKLSHIKRKFFECDDIKKAHRKLKRCEMSSDIQSSDLENNNQIKRIRLNKKRWSSSSTDSDVASNHSLGNLNREKSTKLPRLSGLPQLTKPASLALPGSSFTNGAVQIKFPAATQSEVENAIKIWLKQAKQRMQKTSVAPIQLHK